MNITDAQMNALASFAAFGASDDKWCDKNFPAATDPANNKKCKKDKIWYAKPNTVVGRKQRGLPQDKDSIIGQIVGSVSTKDVKNVVSAAKDLKASKAGSPGSPAPSYDPMAPGGAGSGGGFAVNTPLLIGSAIVLGVGIYLYSRK